MVLGFLFLFSISRRKQCRLSGLTYESNNHRIQVTIKNLVKRVIAHVVPVTVFGCLNAFFCINEQSAELSPSLIYLFTGAISLREEKHAVGAFIGKGIFQEHNGCCLEISVYFPVPLGKGLLDIIDEALL